MILALILPIALLAAIEETPPKGPPTPPKPKKICRVEEATGTMFAKRICLTAKEWAEFDGANQNRVDSFQRRPNYLQPPDGQ
ncbi:MAG: hypothetical protein A4S12_00160 [Proteobacteria bacterium SG_bin5]|nr:hypothetical protein [Sphingomonas sp.]OQW44936.1 MAG: hypothetical protein A4S12_00160 [Proteobacteria bacterium SG_bin5]